MNTLLHSLSKQCRVDLDQAGNIISSFQTFVIKLKLSFGQARTNPEYGEILRELGESDIWKLMKRIDPLLLKQLKMLRGQVDELKLKGNRLDACLEWIVKLLGDKWNSLHMSYLELLIRSLSLTTDIQMAELSNKQLILVISEFRRMHLETEHLSRVRNEELREFYVYYLLTYNSLINFPLEGDLAETTVKLTSRYFPSELADSITPDIPSFDIYFLRRYNVDPEKDFIRFDNQMHLRKTTNLSLVNDNWIQMTIMIPERTRRNYFDERMGLSYNIKVLERLINKLHMQTPTNVVEWSRKVIYLCVAFDLIESMVAYEGHQVNMPKLKDKLLDILAMYVRIKAM